MWRRMFGTSRQGREGGISGDIEAQIKAAEREWIDGYMRGPTRLRWTKVPPQVGDHAPDFELPDAAGRSMRLRDAWQGRPALILFWRHYGCGCGMDRASRLQQEYPEFVAAGANVVIVGQGEPERASAYAQAYGLPVCPILCDPDLRAYEGYGLLEGKPSQIFFDAPEALLRREPQAGLEVAAARRAAGRPLVDNGWQLPGEFVIDRTGVFRLAYRYQYCEDFPNPLVLIAAIKEAHTLT